MPEVADLSIRHNAIMDFMLANPTVKMGEVAAFFGVSQPWLSCIVHSHAFKTKLREKQDVLFGDLAATITEKLEAIAHTALDNLGDHLAASNAQPAFNLEVADRVLTRLGYGVKTAQAPAAPTQVNVFQVSKEDLAQARTLLNGSVPVPALEQPAIQGEANVVCSYGSAGSEVLANTAAVPSGN